MKSMKVMKSSKMSMKGSGGNYVGGTVLDQMLQEVPSNVVGGAKKPRKSSKKTMMGGADAMASQIPHMVGGVASSSMGHTVGGKVKSTRPLSAYNLFIKNNYEKAKHLDSKQRMKYLAGLWKESKK